MITDTYDFNTASSEAKHDNNMYAQRFKKNLGLNYEGIRAAAPYLNSIDIMPNDFKIKSEIKL
ncbi:MAG: hypothetical protein ACI30B_03665 [Paludibacteraceae bacterium]